MLRPLTKREKEILDFIKVSSQIHGFSPSLIEIRNHFRLSAVSTVHEHITNLKRKGYISKEVSQARSITVIDSELVDQTFLEIPISYELSESSKLDQCIRNNSVFVHSSMLKGKGNYYGIKINNTLYAEHGIFKGDILIIKDALKLPFNINALVETGNSIVIGEIIEHKQLPAFKKFTKGNIVIINFEIKGEFVLLIRKPY